MTIIAGIVCEYNPFHNGHLLQINALRQEKGADAVICAMSGHFLQRGEPSVVEKDRRVMMALSSGADLVVEIPALYATRSAYWFALGSVSLLAAAGATHLAFGAETDDLPSLLVTADRLVNPDSAYAEGLRRFLSAGLSYSEAQAKALNSGDHRHFVPVLPNDRLALSYLRVILEKELSLTPILIPREGSGYLETGLPEGSGAPASATAIRKRLQEGVFAYRSKALTIGQLAALGLTEYIPESALPWLADTPLVFSRDGEAIQLALLRRASLDSLQALPDMTEGLEYRVVSAAGKAGSMDEFYYLMKTKRYTMTRLQRMVTHLTIDYRQAHAAYLREGPPYLRILGANGAGQQILRRIKKTTAVPVVTRTSQIKTLAKQSAHAAGAWEIELRATAMRCLLSGADFSKGNPEYFLSTIMV